LPTFARSGVLNRDLKLFFTSNFIGAFGDGLYSYLLPYYIKENLKAGPDEVGLLYALTSLTAAITLFAAGMVADKYDRKKIIIAGWMAWLPAPVIFSFAQNWIQMLPGMILWGFWLSGSTATAYIITSTDKRNLTLTFTVISSSWSLGYIFSPALGGYIASIMGMQTVFYLSAILYMAACLTLVFISSQRPASPPQGQHSFKEMLKSRELAVSSLIFAIALFVPMMIRPFVPQFLADAYGYGDFEIGLLGSISFLGSAVLGILLGKFGDKIKRSYALAASMLLCGLFIILLWVSGNFYVLAAALFFAGATYITWSLASAMVGPLAPEYMRAKWIAVPQTIGMLCSFLAPYVGGVLYKTSPYNLLVVTSVASIISALIILKKAPDEL